MNRNPRICQMHRFLLKIPRNFEHMASAIFKDKSFHVRGIDKMIYTFIQSRKRVITILKKTDCGGFASLLKTKHPLKP